MLIKDFRYYYENHLTDFTKIYPGVIDTLELLKDYKKAIISNKYEAYCIRALNELGLKGYFDIIVCSDTIPEKKPSPIPVIHVLSSLNVKHEEAVIVGDSLIDIMTGKASSLITVAVTYGYGQSDFYKKADYVIEKMPELLDILKTIDACH